MKESIFLIICMAVVALTTVSCKTMTGAGGANTGVNVITGGKSTNSYDLVPVGDRITYTIDISTPEGQQKLHKLSLSEAQRLAEIEASRKYNCDRLIDPRFDYLKKGRRILRITVDGRPGNYQTKDR